jgi:hypothetical protein
MYILFAELVTPIAAFRIACLEEDALATAYALTPQFVRADGARPLNLDDPGGAYRSIERHRLQTGASRDEMAGSIHVRACVQAHADRGEVEGVTALQVKYSVDL